MRCCSLAARGSPRTTLFGSFPICHGLNILDSSVSLRNIVQERLGRPNSKTCFLSGSALTVIAIGDRSLRVVDVESGVRV